MYHRNIYECSGVPNIGAPAPATARGNTSADAKKAAEAQVGVPQLGKDPNRIRFAQARKDFATGRPIVICAGIGTRAVGIVCRCSIPHGTTGMPRLLRGGQRGESASPDQTTLPQPVRDDATGTHDERRHHTHEPGPCGVLHLHQLGQVHRFVPFAAALWYQQRNTQHATTFTVAHSESLPDARVHRGSHKHASHTTTTRLRRRSLHIHEFPDIISAILELNYFMVGGRVVRQARGAPMGSPASPALCSMVVAVHEQAWVNTYRNHLYNAKHLQPDAPHPITAGFFATRHVDNRLMVIPTRMTTLPPFAELIHTDFFVPPVELETEPGHGFLGMELDPDQFAIHYTRQIQLNDVPSPHSATTSTVLHSSMRARLRQARSMCMPQSVIAMAEAALKGGYLAAGHDPRMIH